jgi:hypothetical protein
MKSTRFNTFTYDVVDEITLGQIEKIAGLRLDYSPDDIHVPTSAEMQELPSSDVAIQLYHPSTGFTNKYACFSPGLTQLNIQLLLDKEEILPDEICKTAAFFLARAARNQGVPVVAELDRLAGTEKLASNIVELSVIDETTYAKKTILHSQKIASVKTWALPAKKRYPLDTAEDLEKAASYFAHHYRNFETGDRIEFALNTCKVASVLDVDLEGPITKYANLDLGQFNDNFERHVAMRKDYVVDADDKVIYDELLEKHAELGVVTSARALEAIDNHYGLTNLWDTKLADPITATCSFAKEAEVEIDGQYVNQSQLTSLLGKDVSGWIDDQTKTELGGDDGLDILKSLPEPTREGLMSEME